MQAIAHAMFISLTDYAEADILLRSSTFRNEAFRTVPLHCVSCQGDSLSERSSTFAESMPKRTSEVPIFSTLYNRLLGSTCGIPMGHGTGLRLGTHRGTVRFALECSG